MPSRRSSRGGAALEEVEDDFTDPEVDYTGGGRRTPVSRKRPCNSLGRSRSMPRPLAEKAAVVLAADAEPPVAISGVAAAAFPRELGGSGGCGQAGTSVAMANKGPSGEEATMAAAAPAVSLATAALVPRGDAEASANRQGVVSAAAKGPTECEDTTPAVPAAVAHPADSVDSSLAADEEAGRVPMMEPAYPSVMPPERIRALLARVAGPNARIDDDAARLLSRMADKILDDVVTAAIRLARHRGGKCLEASDLRFVLEEDYGVT